MAYQTGTSTGPDDLLDKLRIFLNGDGWTVNSWATDGTGKRLHVQKGSSPTLYFNFRSATNEYGSTITEDNFNGANGAVTGILVNGSTGYSGAQPWHKQPGYAQNIDYNDYSFGMVISPVSVTAIPSYYFFTVDRTVHIAVEITSGKFQFISFGCLEKEGSYTGGQFFTGSFSSRTPYDDWDDPNGENYAPDYFRNGPGGGVKGAVYVDADSVADFRIAEGDDAPEILFPCVVGQQGNEYYSQKGICSHFWEKSPNFYNAIPAFCPVYIFVERSDGNYSLLGEPAGLRFLNTRNYSQGQQVTYGGDDWLIFHADSQEADPENVNAGFAFKKVV